MQMASLDDPALRDAIGGHAHGQLTEELELLDGAGTGFDRDAFAAGQVTPVFFGSAMTNFGVEPFLDRFVELAPPPRPGHESVTVDPAAPFFSGFVFKIQANMDPQHRDRIAFLRICSGRFERGMEVQHVRTGKPLTLARRAVPGAGAHARRGGLRRRHPRRVGSRPAAHRRHPVRGPSLEFEGIPRFSPEHFVRVRLTDPLKRKQLKKGLDQLSEEGAVQLFFDRERLERDPILGAVGVLQFEVIQHRLKSEYGVACASTASYQHARWVEGESFDPDQFMREGGATCVIDVEGRPLVLFENDLRLQRPSTTTRSCASSPPCSPRAAARAAA